MEAFGIALYALGGLLAAPLFCLLIARYSRRFLTLSAIAWWGSAALLTLFVLDVAWVHLAGAVSVRAAVGAAFFPLHAVATLLAAPAFASLLLAGRWNLSR
jgi:uncharacterized paraquat-inducible protein A